MYELQVKNKNGEWEAYPDPLRADLETAQAKKMYCENYELAHDMPLREYRIIKLDDMGIKKHAEDWKKWCGMID